MTYYPSGHEDLLFGGYGEPVAGSGDYYYLNDTWAFADGAWTELISNTSCTAATCPIARAGAEMAYYPPLNAVLLFGGYEVVYISELIGVTVTYNDTWLFYNDTWHNVTATAGAPPSGRYDEAMVWDSYDGYDLLYGGVNTLGQSLGDSWSFNGTWHNITATAGSTGSRDAAAIANAPNGYILLYGGETNGVIIQDGCGAGSAVAWWFHAGKWIDMTKEDTCTAAPSGVTDQTNSTFPPCGRVNAALGWSPQNNRFVLYGGFGPPSVAQTSCGGTPGYLNDTWLYENPTGDGFYFLNGGDSGDPPARAYMGYASDFSDGFFEIFGGYDGVSDALSQQTWRFFEMVHARLSGPASLNTNNSMSLFTSFTVVGYGGSGTLNYSFTDSQIRNDHQLSSNEDCGYLWNTTPQRLPYDGTSILDCLPTPASYNVYRLTVTVVDVNNSLDYASASWVVTVVPPESAAIYSEYTEFFYQGFSLANTFSAYLNVANTSAQQVIASIGGSTLTFSPRSGSAYWWDAPAVDMGSVRPGSEILLQANFAGWSLNTTYQVETIDTPSWLSSLFTTAGATQTIQTAGPGPYNKVFWINETFDWNLADALGFSIPVPLVGGSYSLIPDAKVVLSASSMGALSLSGTLSVSTPDIDIGVFSLSLSASLSLTGRFQLTSSSYGSAVSGIEWVGAEANVSVAGTFSGSIPIYGFSILGVTIGFVLDLSVSPSVALSLLLGPLSGGAKAIGNGIDLMLDSVFGSFTLPLTASINFGIGIASVGIGGTLSIALEFSAYPSLGIVDGWVNGSLFVQAQFLFWSDSWNLVGPGTIYSWDPPPGGGPITPGVSSCPTCYDDGTNTSWSLQARYYDTSGYDALVWNASSDSGPAISDIYPHTELGAASGAAGAYVFYTDDDVALPVDQGLRVSGVELSGSTNALSQVPAPSDPGFEIANPVATTLSDGTVYVVWAALPNAETTDASPLDLTSMELHGARFYPNNQTWGPVHTFSDWGIAESYQLDGSGAAPRLVALLASTPLVGESSLEHLVTYNLTSGAQLTNVSLSGFDRITSLSAALGDAVVELLNGNTSVVSLATGTAVPLSVTVPANTTLVAGSFVQGSSSTVALLYREPNASEVVLYDVATGTTLGVLSVPEGSLSVAAMAGVGQVYVLVGSATGVKAWSEAAGTFTPLASFAQTNTKSFEVVQSGSALVLVLLATNGNTTAPIATLVLDELAATLTGVPGQPPSTVAPTTSSPNVAQYELYLGLGAAGVVILLAVVALISGRRSRSPGAPPMEAWQPPSTPPPPPGATGPPPPPG